MLREARDSLPRQTETRAGVAEEPLFDVCRAVYEGGLYGGNKHLDHVQEQTCEDLHRSDRGD